MNILVCANAGYFEGGITLIRSIAKNNRFEPNSYYIAYPERDTDSAKAIKQAKRFINQSDSIIPIALPSNFKITRQFKFWSPEIWNKIISIFLLPSTCDRVLYIDSDCIVNGSIRELYYRDMDLYAVCGVRESPVGFPIESIIEDMSHYVNAGVLLIDVSCFLEILPDFNRLLFEVEKIADYLECPDQDFLNALFENHVLALSEPKYNFRVCNDDEKEINGTPSIIHYASVRKPWRGMLYPRRYPVKYYRLWWKYGYRVCGIKVWLSAQKIKMGNLVRRLLRKIKR